MNDGSKIDSERDPIETLDPEATLIAEGAPDHDLIEGVNLRAVMGALMLTMTLASLDQTIVGVALPRIVSEFHGLNHLSWVVTAYLLASTASTPIWGKISDLYGRKKILQTAIGIFLLGSVLAGISQSMLWLIITRGIQGLGGGGLMVLVMAVIADVVSPRDRGKYTGMFGAVFAVSSIAGPLLGGFFVDNLSWRWIFYINIPLGIISMIVIGAVLHVPPRHVDHKIDYLGATLLIAGVALLLLVAEWGGNQYAWASVQIISMSVASVMLILLFVWLELRVSEPIVPMGLFKNKVFSMTSLIGFIVGLALFGAMIYLPMYLQVVQRNSPTEAGLKMIPMMAGMLSASIVSGRLISRYGRYKLFPIVGMALATFSMDLFSTLKVDTSIFRMSLFMVVLGLGIGNVMQVLILAVQNAVNPKDVGVATSGSTFFRSIGGTFGLAIFGGVFTSSLSAHLFKALPSGGNNPATISKLTDSMTNIASLPKSTRAIALSAFTDSLDHVFLIAMPIMAFGFFLSLFLKEIKLRSAGDPHHARV